MSTKLLQAIVETVLTSGCLYPDQQQEISQRFLAGAVSPADFQSMKHLDRALLKGEVNYVTNIERKAA
jgi:hypothetical protein